MRMLLTVAVTFMTIHFATAQTMVIHLRDGNTAEYDLEKIVKITYSSSEEELPTRGLIAHYPFNGNANDATGNGHDGAVTGATLTTDRFGNHKSAYYFDGRTSHIVVSNSSYLNPQTISIAIWVYYQGGNGNPRILSKWEWGKGDSYQIAKQPQGTFFSVVKKTQPVNFYFGTDFTFNTWEFLVITKDNETVKVYVNSKLIHTGPYRGTLEGNSGNLVFGVNGGTIGTSQDRLNGKLDDARIYDRALSSQEIEALYHENGWK